MSYLLMQIFICLLIAGVIGLLIGWLLRGGCNKKILNNDDKWNSEVESINSTWDAQVQALMNDQKSTVLSNNIKLSKLENKLYLANNNTKDLDLDWSSKFSEYNLLWKNKLKNTTSDWASKVENTNETWKKKLQETVTQNNSKVTLLNNSYSKAKTELLVSENQVKGFKHDVIKLIEDKKDLQSKLTVISDKLTEAKDENKLIDSKWNTKFNDASNSWKDKIQALMGSTDEKTKELRAELNEMKTSSLRVEIENKEINSKLIELEKGSKEKENKAQGLMSGSDEKIKNLNIELNEVKAKFLKVEEENQEASLQLKSIEKNSQNMQIKLEESEKRAEDLETETKKHSVDLLNTIYEWKQKYQILENEKSSFDENKKLDTKKDLNQNKE